jgi:hypothetical protein
MVARVMSIAPRTLALGVFALGVVVGTITDRVPARVPPRAGEYTMLSGDFHVHAFPGDGALTPGALRDEAARAGLDVIAITNHNQMFTARWAQRSAARTPGPIVIAGQEITNPGYHLIGLGVQRPVDADQPVVAAAADVHAQGGVAVVAHPSWRAYGYHPDDAVMAVDGTELAHYNRHRAPVIQRGLTRFFERARDLKPGVAAIGSTDFHGGPVELGTSRTYLFVREQSAAGVLEAIRSGRTLAVDGHGRLHGNPALAAIAEQHRPAGRRDEHAGWRRLSVGLAWLGALGAVCLRGRRDGIGQ